MRKSDTNLVLAFHFTPSNAIVVLDKLANAHVTVLAPGALETILVRLAHRVQLVNGTTETGIAHWPIAENEAVATVRPVFALVEVVIVILHHVSELEVAFLSGHTIFIIATTLAIYKGFFD